MRVSLTCGTCLSQFLLKYVSKSLQYRTVQWPSKIMHFAWVKLYSPSPRSPQLEKDTTCISDPLNRPSAIRMRRFRFKFFFASKRNEVKLDSFRFGFACLSENFPSFFSPLFASQIFLFALFPFGIFLFASVLFFSLCFASVLFFLLRFLLPYFFFALLRFRIFLFALLRYRVFFLLRFASVFFVLLQSENK